MAKGCYDETCPLINQERIILAFKAERVSAHDLLGSTGYGYNDLGREKLEAIYASVFGGERALVRPQIASGTHALWLALNANTAPGQEVLAVTGEPYATMKTVLSQTGPVSFSSQGKTFNWVNQLSTGEFDFPAIEKAINSKTQLIYIQKSRGYSLRKPVSNAQIGELCRWLRNIFPAPPAVMVDNCYGEFVEDSEPGHHGADLTVGSLIKNPGGGLAETGGYLVGRNDLVQNAGDALYAPGLNSEIGATGNYLKGMFQGLFQAPHHVGQALKNVRFAAALADFLGYNAIPGSQEERFDLVQAIILETPQAMEVFAASIQATSPIDSYAVPTPGPVPGYTTPVIMAAGTFIQGASLELTCDGPAAPPYILYLQGGLAHEHGLLAIAAAFAAITE
jgi:cystathionine beta-lyase family protein involved in aluminum resistance